MADEQGQDIKAETGQEDAEEGDNKISFEDVITGLAGELANADSPGTLLVVYQRRRDLLGNETVIEGLSALTQALLQSEGDKEKILGKILLFRLGLVQLWREESLPVAASGEQAAQDMMVAHARVEVEASTQGVAVGSMQGGITQNNTTYNQNAALEQGWLRPAQVGLKKNFVGRERELEKLREQLLTGQNVVISGRASPAVTVQGMGGIGKTFLAERLAQELNAQFSAGVIWQSVGPQRQTKEQAEELLNELAKYAFNNQRPIGRLDSEQVRAWLENAVADRALLVMLDDVWSVEALRVLDEAIPAQAVRLVTTRKEQVARYLSGYHCELERLSAEDGLALLVDRLQLSESDQDAYREPLQRIVVLLGGHALALDISAARVRRPTQIPMVVASLEEAQGKNILDMLKLAEGDLGDDTRETNLELSFALSYTQMSEEQRRCFRALGVCAPEVQITMSAVAALWEMSDDQQAQRMLETLANLALLNETDSVDVASQVYTQHGLLRAYALALLKGEQEWERVSWLHACYYNELVRQTDISDYPALYIAVSNIEQAISWSKENEPVIFLRLIEVTSQLLLMWGRAALLENCLPGAVLVAESLQDKSRQANVLKSLGDLERRLGEVDEARRRYEEALPLYRVERARLGEANLLLSKAYLSLSLREWQEARKQYEQALNMFLELRDPLGQANAHLDLGACVSFRGMWNRLWNMSRRRWSFLVLRRLESGYSGPCSTRWRCTLL